MLAPESASARLSSAASCGYSGSGCGAVRAKRLSVRLQRASAVGQESERSRKQQANISGVRGQRLPACNPIKERLSSGGGPGFGSTAPAEGVGTPRKLTLYNLSKMLEATNSNMITKYYDLLVCFD
uniref:Uncharacterized protein n=1 Tax=Knipowitschia caucasica TaxID=637954 RepID=A0AAV2LRS7_KNICA